MNHLDLFSGLGGFALGANAAGYTTIAFVECEPYAQAILGTHWPDVPLINDVRSVAIEPGHCPRCELCEEPLCELCEVHLFKCDCLTESQWFDTFPHELELITAGWPCQDVSRLGDREGLAGTRSGLWAEVVRIVGTLRPRRIMLENVPNVLQGDHGGWMGRVLGDLAGLGYDAEWRRVDYQSFGIRQHRERLFIMADDNRRERHKSHERPLMYRKIQAAPFERGQPYPHGGRAPFRPSDRMDIGARISACANAVSPQIVHRLLEGLKP